MANILNLSFGCGTTLQASQLNRIVDAINQLATQVETIGDQVEIYIPLSGSENISGVLAPNINEGHDLGKSNKRWATVWASTGGFKTVDFYDQQSPYSKLGRLEINQDGRLQYDDEPLALLSDINNEVNSDNQSFIHFGQNVRGRLDEDYVRIPASLRLDDVDDNEEEDISNNYYNLYCGGINIKGTEFAQVGNRIIEKDDGKEHHTLCVRDGELLFDGNPIGSNPQLGNVLEGINELDLPESSKYLYYNSDNQSFEWADGTGTSGNNVIGLPTGSTSSTSQISLNTNTLSVKSGEGISLTSNTTSFRNIADQNEEVGIIDSTSDPNGRKLFINSGNKGVYIDRLYLYDNQGHTTQITGNGTGITSLSGLSDVSSYTSDQGKYLKVNSNGDGTEWSNISLSDLSNTEIGGLNNALSNGQVLVYDSSLSNWKNTSLPANLPSVSGHANEYLKVKSDGTQAEWTSVTPGGGTTYKLTLNGTTNGDSSSNGVNLGSFYAPTSLGTAGQVLKVNSSATGVEWGTDNTSTGGGVSDVKVNTTSVVSNNVATIPLASSNTFGVVKIGTGITINNGVISAPGTGGVTDNSVYTNAIQNNAVTNDKIAESVHQYYIYNVSLTNLCLQLGNALNKTIYMWYNTNTKEHNFFVKVPMSSGSNTSPGYYYVDGNIVITDPTTSNTVLSVPNLIFYYSGDTNGTINIPVSVSSSSSVYYYKFLGNGGIETSNFSTTYLGDVCYEIAATLATVYHCVGATYTSDSRVVESAPTNITGYITP